MSSKEKESRLLHPSLNGINKEIRFGVAGVLATVSFILLNSSLKEGLEDSLTHSTIYAISYVVSMPVTFLLNSGLVFGWPQNFISSFLSTVPIGLTGMALGTFSTGYLERIGFDAIVETFVKNNLSFSNVAEEVEEISGGYVPYAVTAITGLWSYVLTNAVLGGGSSKKHEKEL
mmetsp:Transcript_3538/g.3912  ORF Transcript_3538/g.3912 Transcript_3538/m.3912 type:complete len:174 (+) Transcript_3538:79-600(+)